jgi:hypothetical protein
MPHNQFVVKKSQWRANKMQKRVNLGGQNRAIENWEPKIEQWQNLGG